MSDPILSTTGTPGAGGDPEAVLDDDATVEDVETARAESQQTATNDSPSL